MTASTQAAPGRVRVLLLNGHGPVRRALRTLLEDEGMEVVGACGSAAEAPTLIRRTRPDVVVLDSALPDGSGLEACRQIRRLPGDVRCVILTSHADARHFREAMLAGASSLVLRRIRDHGLPAAIRRAAR